MSAVPPADAPVGRTPHNAGMHDPRRLPGLQGATNFRDLGGYPGQDGRPLRWRRLFRSDHLGGLTESDREAMRALGITRAFDFRGEQERAAQPYALEGLRQHALSIEPTVAQNMTALVEAGLPLTAERVTELMEMLYRRLVDEESGRYAEWFGHLLEDDSPLVFHCTAGKDRTGVAAALLMRALGVPHEVVEHDYLYTNQVYRRPHTAGSSGLVPEDALQVLWTVQPRFLDAAFDTIERMPGGLEGYFTQRLKLGPAARAKLMQMYLEAPGGAA
jgi:protein-tyrosine phosphatase